MASPIRRVPYAWATVYALSTAEVFLPTTGWMSATTVASLRPTPEMRARTGNIEIAFAYQTANAEGSPDTAVALTAWLTADGIGYNSFVDVSSATGSKQMIRFGIMVRLSTGAALGLARVSGALDIQAPG